MPRPNKQTRHDLRFGKPSRIADMLQSFPWAIAPWMDLKEETIQRYADNANLLKTRVRTCPVIVADNVGEYFYAESPQQKWDYQTGFAPSPPPFDEFFVEFKKPSGLNNQGKIHSSSHFPDRWGWHVTVAKPEAVLDQMQEQRQALDAMARGKILSDDAQEMWQWWQDNCDPSKIPADTRWVIKATLVTNYGRNLIASGFTRVTLDPSGSINSEPLFGSIHLPKDKDKEKSLLTEWSSLFMPVVMTLAFMGCKNVKLEQVFPDRKLNRARREANLPPFVHYSTIAIEPLTAAASTSGLVRGDGSKKALHIARGHFATYAEDKPLFGRTGQHGSFWVPSHVRGAKSQGEVIKSYTVNPPKIVTES